MLVHLPTAAQKSGEEVEVMAISLPGRHWKWRMQASALTLVERLESKGIFDNEVDAFIVTDMMDVGQFRAALPKAHRGVPIVLYFHENQLTYPVREGERLDVHHGLTNIHSVLAADHTLFNSAFHRDAFLGAAKELLERVPDLELTGFGESLESESSVLGLGTDMRIEPPARLA